MSGLSNVQQAYQATEIQSAATIIGSVQQAGTQAPLQAPPGASLVETEAIGLQGETAGILNASIEGLSTPPPTPLEAPGTNQYQAALTSDTLNQASTLFGTLGIGTQANSLA